MTTKPTTVDEYLAGLRPDQRAALTQLRKAIRAAAPDAVECITYGLPGFRLHGRVLVAFGARPGHCAFFPMSGTTIAAHQDKLRDFETSKGTIRFQPDAPPPASLVRLIVRARIAENAVLASPPARRRSQAARSTDRSQAVRTTRGSQTPPARRATRKSKR